MIIKNRPVGAGKPLLCVPVTEQSTSGIIETVNHLTLQHVDAIEWRVDYYQKSGDPQLVKSILQEIRRLLGSTILIFTYRTSAEGGLGNADDAYYETLLRTAADTGVPDLIDLEFAVSHRLPMLMASLHACGVRVIASYHNFDFTPTASQMTKQFRSMFSAGADIAKIAVMPQDFSDVCNLLKASEAASDPQKPVIAISMGQTGAVSRLVGEVCGSCLTFVTEGAASAPGQMSYRKVSRALDDIHACITEGSRNNA